MVNNGLPLRSDIHTLYDLDLIAIDPDTYEVALSPASMGLSTHHSPGSSCLTRNRIHSGQIAGFCNPDGMTSTPRYEAQHPSAGSAKS